MRASMIAMGLVLLGGMVLADAPATTQAAKDVVVRKGSIHPRIDAEGYFEPVDALEVRFRPEAYQGDLKIMSVAPHGASVKKGDTLLAIDAEEIGRQIAAAQRELTNTQAAAEKTRADVTLGEKADALAMTMQEKELADTQAGLKWWDDVDGKHMLEGAALQTKNSKAAVEDQQDELNELKKMYKTEELTNATADIVVKRALRALETGKIEASMAEQREGKVKDFDYGNERQRRLFGIEQQSNALEQLKAAQSQAAVNRKMADEGAQAALDRAQKKLDNLKSDLENLTVKAPFDGVVYYGQLSHGAWQNSGEKALRVGEKVPAGGVVMTLAAPEKLRMSADVPESRLLWIKAGMKARIVPLVDSEATTDGTCGTIVPAGPANEGFQLPIELEKAAPLLAPGEKAGVHIELPEVKDVLIVPAKLVKHGQVRMQSDDEQEIWKDVVTGMSDEKNVEIKSGLNEGDQLFGEK